MHNEQCVWLDTVEKEFMRRAKLPVVEVYPAYKSDTSLRTMHPDEFVEWLMDKYCLIDFSECE